MKTRLRVLRAEKEWSQAELAAHVGVARGTINAIETGKYDPVCRSLSRSPASLAKAWKKFFFIRRTNNQQRRIPPFSYPHRFTTRWCSHVRRLRSARRRFSSCAGRMCTGTRGGFKFQSAGPREKTEKQKPMCRTVTSLYIRFWPGIFARGNARRRMRVKPTLCSRRSEQRVGSHSALLYSSPTTCDQPQRKPEYTSMTAGGSDFTTCVTRFATGW